MTDEKEINKLITIKELAKKAHDAADRMVFNLTRESKDILPLEVDREYLKQSADILDAVEELNTAIVEWQKVNE